MKIDTKQEPHTIEKPKLKNKWNIDRVGLGKTFDTERIM